MTMSPNDVFKAVTRQLLNGETLTADQVREMGVDPNMSGLIHGADDSGTMQYPAFQFKNRQVVSRVMEINTMMNADRDPWGVWSWWVQPNIHLGKIGDKYRAPVDLLHTAGDYQLKHLVEDMYRD